MKQKDQEEIRKRATEFKDVLAQQAERIFESAQEMTRAGVRAAAPAVMTAVHKTVQEATPYVDQASDTAAKFTAQAGHTLEHVHDELVGDYLPKLQKAVELATAHALVQAGRLDHPLVAAVEAETKKRNRRRRMRSSLKWGAVAAGTAGVAYLVWRRSKPIEDPWAEEYWADLETDVDVSDVPTEDVAEAVSDKAEDVADTATDAAEDVADAVTDVADEAAEKVEEVKEEVQND